MECNDENNVAKLSGGGDACHPAFKLVYCHIPGRSDPDSHTGTHANFNSAATV